MFVPGVPPFTPNPYRPKAIKDWTDRAMQQESYEARVRYHAAAYVLKCAAKANLDRLDDPETLHAALRRAVESFEKYERELKVAMKAPARSEPAEDRDYPVFIYNPREDRFYAVDICRWRDQHNGRIHGVVRWRNDGILPAFCYRWRYPHAPLEGDTADNHARLRKQAADLVKELRR